MVSDNRRKEIMIHSSSVIDKKQKFQNVKIGPFCFVGPKVVLDDNVELVSNVHIEAETHLLEKETKIFPFCKY